MPTPVFQGRTAASHAQLPLAHLSSSTLFTPQMAKAAPSKKTAKAAKTASTGAKKARRSKRSETFNSYIHKVLKQVHPGAFSYPFLRGLAVLLHALTPINL